MSRGYFGGKSPENLGGLWRSAHAFGASFVFTIGPARYSRRDKFDTSHATRSIPLFEFDHLADATDSLPAGIRLVGVECPDDCAVEPSPLATYVHHHRAAYLLGAEDHGLHGHVQQGCHELISLPTAICLNVATAGSIVLYDRAAKAARA